MKTTKKIRALILTALIAFTMLAGLPAAASAAGSTAPAGWHHSGGSWYYYKNGVSQTGWLKDGSAWYYLKPDGTMATGWLKDGGSWYYLKLNGAMATGWVKDGGNWYYLSSNGTMVSDVCLQIGGKAYCFDSTGRWIPDKDTGSGSAFPYKFSATDIYGNKVSESSLGDKEVYFIHLWATWCQPCVKEMPDLARLVNKYGDKVGFLGLITDAYTDSSKAQGIVQKAGIPESFIMIDAFDPSMGDILALLQSGYVPTTVLVSGGSAGEQILGAHGSKYSSYIDKLLK